MSAEQPHLWDDEYLSVEAIRDAERRDVAADERRVAAVVDQRRGQLANGIEVLVTRYGDESMTVCHRRSPTGVWSRAVPLSGDW